VKHLWQLSVRLFLSYLAVIATGAATLAIVLSILAPSAFDHRMMRGSGTPGNGMGGMGGFGAGKTYHQAFVDALRTSLPIAILISVAVAAVVAGFVARRIVRPINNVRRAAARMIDGHYDERIPEPRELELAALARDINGLASSLETTERRRSELIGEVAHEMRTPLTVIDGYVEGILDGVFPPDEEVLTAIGAETARLGRLARDLSALSRADEGALALTMSSFDLAVLAVQVTERLRPQFEAKGVALHVQSAGHAPVVADEQRITQVLTNLIGNALTYTGPGGKVSITMTRGNASAGVVVTDTGVGLDTADLNRVFDRFYRVPGIARPNGGSGIGLTIARSIARAHGGDVHARSLGPGHGASFELILPTHRSQPTTADVT